MVSVKPFETVDLITITDGEISAEFIPFGAAVRSIIVPDKNGNPVDICLGYDDLEQYKNLDACFGGTIGRCANRIGGASFAIDGVHYNVTANEGANQLHGGIEGFHKKLWDYKIGENSVTFMLDSSDGDEGFPGNLHAEVTYTVKDSTLFIDYSAVSDKDTVVNLTNHAYFNLGGHNSGSIGNHRLTVRAESYTPAGEGNIPTGETAAVEGTPLDLRSGALIADRLGHPFLEGSRGFDHNFVLDKTESAAAELFCPETGIGLEMFTDLEGMQLYSAGFLTERIGKDGAVYNRDHAICLETQHFPDAVNHPNFPSPIVRAGEKWQSRTSYRFFTVK